MIQLLLLMLELLTYDGLDEVIQFEVLSAAKFCRTWFRLLLNGASGSGLLNCA